MKDFKNNITQNRNTILFFILGIIITIFLDNLASLFQKVHGLAIPGMATISDRILFLTFWALLWYTWETREMKKEMVHQGKLEQKPIMLLYIRHINDYVKNTTDPQEKEEMRRKHYPYIIICMDKNKYGIHGKSDYLLRLRNVGKGPAFNVEVKDKSRVFKIDKYQNQFFAPEPKGDEHSFQIKIDDKTMTSWSDINGKFFDVFCKNTAKKEYGYRYKIIDFENREVEFIEEL